MHLLSLFQLFGLSISVLIFEATNQVGISASAESFLFATSEGICGVIFFLEFCRFILLTACYTS